MSLVLLFTDYKNAPNVKIEPIFCKKVNPFCQMNPLEFCILFIVLSQQKEESPCSSPLFVDDIHACAVIFAIYLIDILQRGVLYLPYQKQEFNMLIRKTLSSDLPAIADIYDNARRFMSESGNPNQWSSGKPNIDTAREDMENGVGYVAEENGEILAVFMFSVGEDPTYRKIYDGKWLNDAPYAVIHRIAVKEQGRGLIDYAINYCFSICPNLKIDTHRDNHPMQRALSKRGFKYCGIIYLENGDERLAFQKIGL